MAMTPQEQVELETLQRTRLVEINANPNGRAALEEKHGQVWDSDELRQDFEVLSFCAPWVVVKRRADGVVGSIEFQHAPRLYWGFREDRGQ
jgi:hypothetical protein